MGDLRQQPSDGPSGPNGGATLAAVVPTALCAPRREERRGASGYARSVPGSDPVPEADRLEQVMPPARDERDRHPVPPDTPEADAIEQAMPRSVTEAESSGVDAERIEPVDDDRETSSGS
jgi:hypothetical protein